MEFENLSQSESSDNDRDKSTRRRTFIFPLRVLNAFPDIAPAVLCQLTEFDPSTPSDVLNLIPAATSAQIAQFFDTLSGEPATSLTPASDQIANQPAEDSASLTDESKVTRRALKIPGNVLRESVFHQARRRRPFWDVIWGVQIQIVISRVSPPQERQAL